MAATIIYYLAYVASLGYALPGPKSAGGDEAPAPGQGRRLFLRRALIWAGGLAVAGYGAKLLLDVVGVSTPSKSFSSRGQISPEVTPNDQFYVVSKNIIDPTVDPTTWTLEVTRLAESPYRLTLEELRALPSQTEYVTLECISNPVGGDLMSNALWRGVPLRDLLDRAKLKPGVVEVACFADDGYSDSIPISLAMEPEVMVAYEMNGEPLSREHGAPARLLAPGRFGMKHVKWLTRIEPRETAYRGYWETRGWSSVAEVRTTSRVDVPTDGATLPPEEGLVGGVAFAGARGIQRVEVSADRGRTWREAFLKTALSPYTWVLWTTPWRPPGNGSYTVLVRATDGTGEVQTAVVEDSLPDGATGWHAVTVSVQNARQDTS
jgi:DMSO/TMAO reductase YedYZ molybdopterin-dependent catalytic subunit